MAESVRQRLLNLSRERGEEFQRVLVRYAIERFLYRLSLSEFGDRFTLKGAMLFSVWIDEPHRGTRDLDLWGRGSSEPEELVDVFRRICAVSVDDGVQFDASTVAAARIREDNIYAGVRVRFVATLAGARIPMQVDVGYGDSIDPPPEEIDYPTIIDMPPPRIKAYPREVTVAEKLQAMVAFGIANSRLKDFHDIAELSRRFDFDGERVAAAIRSTFARRDSAVPVEPPAGITPEYYEDPARQAQWRGFLRRAAATDPTLTLHEVVEQIRAFALPPLNAVAIDEPFELVWRPGGPWRQR
jgi:predicted nucleotidyltransferase component of viral defense system